MHVNLPAAPDSLARIEVHADERTHQIQLLPLLEEYRYYQETYGSSSH